MNVPMRHPLPNDLAPFWMPVTADWQCSLATADRLEAADRSDCSYGSGSAQDGSVIPEARARRHPGQAQIGMAFARRPEPNAP